MRPAYAQTAGAGALLEPWEGALGKGRQLGVALDSKSELDCLVEVKPCPFG